MKQTQWNSRLFLTIKTRYLLTQVGFLCDNSGNRIAFNSKEYSDEFDTRWSVRDIL